MNSMNSMFEFSNYLIVCTEEYKMKIVQEHAIITCPICGHREVESKNIDECQYFYDCKCCRITIEPKPGDCCVFNSYGSNKNHPKY